MDFAFFSIFLGMGKDVAKNGEFGIEACDVGQRGTLS